MNRLKWMKKILIIIIVMCLSVAVSYKAQAISSGEVFKRILVNNYAHCYNYALVAYIEQEDYKSFKDSMLLDGYKQSNKVGDYGIIIPAIDDDYNTMSQMVEGGSLDGARVTNCAALFIGDAKWGGTLDGKMSGLFGIYKVNAPERKPDLTVLNNFLNGKMNYTINTDQTSGYEWCYSVYVKEKMTAAVEQKIGSFCRNEDSYPIKVGEEIKFTDEGTGYHISTVYAGTITVYSDNDKCEVITDTVHGFKSEVSCSGAIDFPKGKPEEDFEQKFETFSNDWEHPPNMRLEVKRQVSTGETSKKVTYWKNSEDGWKISLSAVTGGEYKNEFSFSDADKYDFYSLYLTKYFAKKGVDIATDTCQTGKPNPVVDESNSKYYVWTKGKGWCIANLDEEKMDDYKEMLDDGKAVAMTVFSNSERRKLDKVVKTPGDLLRLMGELDYGDEEEFEDINDVDETSQEDGGGGETVEPTCANSGGADKLGWIICPVMEWAIDASKKMYDQYIEPALQVDPILFTGGESSDNTAKSAWNIFRNIANILFAILFLVVIFSQLTGVGIDNYGIKKILPKLILTALLVNLSYYICMVCVDLSNIFGNGLQSILDGMAKGMTISIDGKTPGDAGVGATAISAVAILATLGVVGVAVWKNAAILLPLVISAIGVVIAILFLFVLLSARQAAILMLTVVSPIAFACYMLPNTKKLFDKWLKIGKGLLLVYPICGIMVGGGNFASKLLMATSAAGGSESNGFFQAFTAMLIGIAPIFFIPSTLKGAFAALGNIGAKLSGFGDKMRSGATRGMRNSNLNKRLQERGLENKTRFNAGYKRNGEKKDLNGFQRFIRGGRKNVQRSAIAYQKNVSDKGSLNATEGKDFMLQTQTANVMKELNASGEINSIKDLGTGLEKALVSGDRARIRAYTDALSAKGENGRRAVGEAYDSAVRQGMASNARKTFADNIMTNHAADYKNNSRGIYELAKGINTGSRDIDNNTTVAGYVGSHRAGLARSVTSTTIGNMDDDACGGIFGGYDGKEVSLPSEFLGDTDEAKNDRHALGATIYAALNDQNANIKSGRRSVLEKALELTGYQAEPKTVRIDGGAGAQAGGGAPAVPAARTGIAQEGQAFDVRAMSDETLLDMATNPNASNDNGVRSAAEREFLRRNPDFNNGGTPGTGNNTNQN